MRATPSRRAAAVVTLAVAVLAVVATLVSPAPSPSTGAPRPDLRLAADTSQFQAGDIITDDLFFDGRAMSAADVQAFLARPPSPYDVVVLDPPYELDVDPVLAALVPWLAPDGVVACERRTRGPAPTAPAGLVPERSRRYGEATLWYFSAP